MSAATLTRENFSQSITGSSKPALVEFWAAWCPYCRRITKAFSQVADEYSDELMIGQVNIDDEPELTDECRVDLVPTLVIYKAGQPVASIVAPASKAEIDRFIEEHR